MPKRSLVLSSWQLLVPQLRAPALHGAVVPRNALSLRGATVPRGVLSPRLDDELL